MVNVKKKWTYLFMSISCLFSFMMGCYCFYEVFWYQENTNSRLSSTAIHAESWKSDSTTTAVLTTWTVKLSKQPVVNKQRVDKQNQNTNQGWTQPVLNPWTVNAGYEWETPYERVRNQIIGLWISYEIAEHITREAYTNTEDPKQFVRAIIWVSNAEGSIFKRWLHNNYLWVMVCWQNWCSLRHYETVQHGITHRREMYNRNKRYLRTTPEARLRWNYCASECLYWVWNYNEWVRLLNI